MNDIDKTKVREIQQDLNRQIVYISLYGCKGIRCKNCYLKGYCDHFPEHSMQFAANIIKLSKEKKSAN